jgi:two-component system sensor histidine kinase ChvG
MLAGIRFRLLAFNILLVFLPAAGVLFLDTYEQQLLRDQERTMVGQARVLAAALSERGPLQAEAVQRTLRRLEQRSGARLRVVDDHGEVLADSSLLGPRREPDAEAPPPDDRESWLYRAGALPFRLYRRLFEPPEPPHGTADVYQAGRPLNGREVRDALAGRYGAATRISSGGQRSVTLYSALPIRDEGEVTGAVVVSQSTFRILRALYEVRMGVLGVFLASLGAAVVLSLLVSTTIARPLERLREQAARVLDRRGRLRGHFALPPRHDEIGDLAEALEELRRRLEAHIRYMEAFAGDVSHEFKNPLTSIRTATEVLAETQDAAEQRRFAALVEREVARMEHLLTDLREMGRLDAGAEGSVEEIDLVSLLEGLAEAHRLRGGAAVEISSDGKPAIALASVEGLARAFENLLDNATSLSPHGTSVRVALERSDPETIVRVLDEGPGIPEAHRTRIFERFFSYRPGASAGRHSGLGLAIAKALVEQAGGTITARNRQSGGACIEVRLPRAPKREKPLAS